MIPKVVHFVFGLREQDEPFHFLHYLAIESCRRVVEPDEIYFHHQHLPWGPWWERAAPFVQLRPVQPAVEVLGADYSIGAVPPAFLYAHHADFIRLDALIEHGGIYADLDTVFVRPPRADLFERPFVIGAEPPVVDEITGIVKPSLCNAFLMSEPDSLFARVWRERMGGALNGTWSNHSGFLARALADEMPDAVHVEPMATFFPFGSDRDDVIALLEGRHSVPDQTTSVHLWAHLWWDRSRRDFSVAHAGWCTPSGLRPASTTLADLARPFLGDLEPVDGPRWAYLSLDETSGYGEAADRCRAALEDSGIQLDWTPLVPGDGWGLAYEPAPPFSAFGGPGTPLVVVAHTVAEFLPAVRRRTSDAFLVGHTAWETDRIPPWWVECLDTADLVVVPSQFSADSIRRSATTTPVAVVPHVAPPALPDRVMGWEAVPDDVFVFYTIAEWTHRKAVHLAIEAYLRAFSANDRVLLAVKTSPLDRRFPRPDDRGPLAPGTSAWSLAKQLAGHRDPPAVHLVTRELTAHQLRSLHRRGDCFVSLCRSEGWGLGAFDAAVYGRPVVMTGFGGQLDYLEGSPHLVDFELVPVEDPMGYPSYAPDQRWAEPDLGHAVHRLREVWADREAAARRAAIAGDEPPAPLSARGGRGKVSIGGGARSDVVSTEGRSDSRIGRAGTPVIDGVRWYSFGPGSGYGNASEAYLSGLRAAGVPVWWTPMGWPSTAWHVPFGPLVDGDLSPDLRHRDIANRPVEHDVVVAHTPLFWHDRLALEADGRRLVAFTTWETDRLPSTWPSILDRFDLVVVPSVFNAEVFAAARLRPPIAVVPHIARCPDNGHPPDTSTGAGSTFTVYVMGTWSTRKAIPDAVEAFVAAFTSNDDVRLIIHTTEEDLIERATRPGAGRRSPHAGTSWWSLSKALGGRSNLPEIVLSTRSMTDAEVDDLHRRGDCFLSLSRGEGWGLGAFEAAASGNPVVATGWGATPEFLPEGYPYLVDYDLVATSTDPADLLWHPEPGERWAKARIAHAAALLRHVFEQRDEAKEWGRRSRDHVIATFDAPSVTARLLETLGTPPGETRPAVIAGQVPLGSTPHERRTSDRRQRSRYQRNGRWPDHLSGVDGPGPSSQSDGGGHLPAV